MKKQMLNSISTMIVLFISLALVSCNDIKDKKSNSMKHTYEYSETGCSTGTQTFTSEKAYCDGLLNDELNKQCAKRQRLFTYKHNCDSTFEIPGETPTPTPTPSSGTNPNSDKTWSDRLVNSDSVLRRLSIKTRIGAEEVTINLMLASDNTYECIYLKSGSGEQKRGTWSVDGSVFELVGLGIGNGMMVNGKPGLKIIFKGSAFDFALDGKGFMLERFETQM